MLMLTKKLLGEVPNVYPHSCEDGWLLNVNDVETELYCTNPICPIRYSKKLKEALDVLGFNKAGVGVDTGLKLILDLRLEHHMMLFDVVVNGWNEENRGGWIKHKNCLARIQDQLNEINNKGGFLLERYMQAWNCANVGTTITSAVFNEFETPDQFYNYFNRDGYKLQKYIGKALRMNYLSDTVTNYANFLLQNEEEIKSTAKYFKFKKKTISEEAKSMETIVVCITGSIKNASFDDGSPIKNREDFIPAMIDRYGLKLRFSNSLTGTVQYLINDEGKRTSKYRKVKENDTYRHCVMLTSDVFEVVLQVLKGDLSNVISANQPN